MKCNLSTENWPLSTGRLFCSNRDIETTLGPESLTAQGRGGGGKKKKEDDTVAHMNRDFFFS